MTGSSPRGRALSNVQLWGLTHPASITGHSGRIELMWQRALSDISNVRSSRAFLRISSRQQSNEFAVALTECAADIELLIRGRPMRRSFVVWTNVQTFSSIVPMHRDTRRAGRSDR